MRRAMQLFLTREMCTKHLPIQNAECAQLLYDILKKPEVRHRIFNYKNIQIHASAVGLFASCRATLRFNHFVYYLWYSQPSL